MLLLVAASLLVGLPQSLGPEPHVLFDKMSGIEITIPGSWSWQDRMDIRKMPMRGLYAGDPIFFCAPVQVLRNGKWTYNSSGSPTMKVYEVWTAGKSLDSIARTLKQNVLPDVLRVVTGQFGSNKWVCADYGRGRYRSVQCRSLASTGREFLITFDNSSLDDRFWTALISRVRFLKAAEPSKK